LQFRMIEGLLGTNPRSGKAGGLRRGVGVERRSVHWAAARPEAGADHLVRVRLAGDQIGSGTLRSRTTGEAADCHVEASPEKVHRTALAEEASAELLEHAVGGKQDAPEARGGFVVVGGVGSVLIKRDRVG